MITLTTPAQLLTILGATTTVGYDRAVLSPITLQPFERKIQATVRLTASADPAMETVFGSLTVDLGPGILVFKVEQLDIVRRMQLSAGQITAVQNILNNAQNALESGLITVNVVAGVQSTGT